MDEENGFFMKLQIEGRKALRAVFKVIGSILQVVGRILIGEANQNSRSREVNT